MIINKIKRLIENKYLLREFIIRDLRSRYIGSTMGFFWSVINPIVTLIIYTFLFSVILKVKLGGESGITNFALYLFCGMLPWAAFQETVQRSTTCIIDNGNLIKKLVFPAKILPVYISFSSLITEFISIIILIIAIICILHFVSFYIILLPLIIFFQLLFALGFGFLLATVNVFFRDTAPLTGVFLTVWLYLTPIFYPVSIVPDKFKGLYMLNPMTHLVGIYRDIFLKNQMFSLKSLAYFSLISIVVFAIGYFLFTKHHRKFVDLL